MTRLYVTTDPDEAEELIEANNVNQEPRHYYNEFKNSQDSNLIKRIGFAPMTSIVIHRDTSEKEINRIAVGLIKQGLYVAKEVDGEVQQYFPNDKQEREELIRLSLIKDLDARNNSFMSFAGANLLMYSNNPNQIREF